MSMVELTDFHLFTLASAAMILGILMLVKGGNWTIDSAVYIAKHFGISPLVVGFTIVAFGTSLPELVISLLANLQGSPGIAIGNVVGSNIANILLVIGTCAAFAGITATRTKALVKDLTFMLLATITLAILMNLGDIGRLAGLVMVVTLGAYVLLQYRMAMKGERPVEDDAPPEFMHKAEPYLYLLLGLVVIALGAEFLVRGAKINAAIIGVPEAVIALSVIALGTSLPELSTCLIAAKKGQTEILLGNIIGSNVFNILMIIGVTSIVSPIQIYGDAVQLARFDIWLTLGVSVLFAALLFFFKAIPKQVGYLFIAGYISYNIFIYAVHYLQG